MSVFLFIITNNIIPIFTLVVLGFIMNKKFDLNINTLSKLAFYVFVPSFTFVNLYTTEIPLEMLKVVTVTVLVILTNMTAIFIISKAYKHEKGFKNAFTNSALFFNSGNIGIPLITLVFSSAPFVINGKAPYLEMALTTQVVVMVVQNIFINTLGFINAGSSSMGWEKSLYRIFKMPTIYIVPLAFILKFVPYDITQLVIWPALNYAKDGLIPVALMTLGMQLSRTSFEIGNKEVYLSAIIRLLGGPIFAFLFISLFQMEGVVAQVVMISSGLPTAINTALIAVEYDNYPDFASQAVITTTLLAAISLVFVIYIARIIYPVV